MTYETFYFISIFLTALNKFYEKKNIYSIKHTFWRLVCHCQCMPNRSFSVGMKYFLTLILYRGFRRKRRRNAPRTWPSHFESKCPRKKGVSFLFLVLDKNYTTLILYMSRRAPWTMDSSGPACWLKSGPETTAGVESVPGFWVNHY